MSLNINKHSQQSNNTSVVVQKSETTPETTPETTIGKIPETTLLVDRLPSIATVMPKPVKRKKKTFKMLLEETKLANIDTEKPTKPMDLGGGVFSKIEKI